MTAEKFPFFAEVRIVSSPDAPELEGRIGGIIGISERTNEDGLWVYTVAPDDCDEAISFPSDHLEPTGNQRSQDDYY